MVVGALVGHYDWDHAIGLAARIRRSLLAHGLNLDLLVLDGAGTVVGQVWRDDVEPGERGCAAPRGDDHLAPARAGRWSRLDDDAAGRCTRRVGTRRRGRVGGWQAVAMEPLAEALAPVYSMRRRIGAALALVLVGALVIARGWADRMSRPLRELTRATQEIARAGEVPRPVAVRSRDEIGDARHRLQHHGARARARAGRPARGAAKFAFVGEVAAGIAHEVRTPLGIMRSSAQMLARAVPARPAARAASWPR